MTLLSSAELTRWTDSLALASRARRRLPCMEKAASVQRGTESSKVD